MTSARELAEIICNKIPGALPRDIALILPVLSEALGEAEKKGAIDVALSCVAAKEARAEEREACARIAENNCGETGEQIALEIRWRGEEERAKGAHTP